YINLAYNPQYEALSYVWKKPSTEANCEVLVDGISVSIGENLDQALRCLRHPNVGRTLWVDALCINQSDFQERNHQVGFMRFIYSQACEVLIHL
ncbi:heterokaryon incompatibility, partial [Periconia macrospinosa]